MIESIFSTKIEIIVKDAHSLKKLLDLEMDRKKYARSDSKISVLKNKIIIDIFAKDITALKATVNNYINLLELISKVYEVEL